jgi:L1 cell adhesion molecule like protein
MVSDAEKFKDEDEKIKKRVEAKNSLEGYLFGVRNSITQEQFAKAIQQNDKDEINKIINDTLAWIESNKDESAETFETKQKEVEGKLMPIMQRAYQAAGGGAGGPGGMPGGIDPSMFTGAGGAGGAGGFPGGGAGAGPSRSSGPRVEEVD